ncbi:MAG: polysaccharide biosynthesis/export family protein [Bacteroidota bacterium]
MRPKSVKRIRLIFGLILLLSIVGFPVVAEAQSIPQGMSIPDLTQLRSGAKSESSPFTGKPVAMDAPVNPAEYSVGPGDVLAINVWSSAPKEHTVTVTPEGMMLIPNVGLIDVRGLVLQAAKEKIVERMRRFYTQGDMTVTLLSPRRVVVQIVGSVINEGTYEMSSVERVDQLVTKGNQPTESQLNDRDFAAKVDWARQSASHRHIVLQRRDGTVHKIDLIKYYATGEGRFNPYLHEGDQVFIPELSPLSRSVGVYGAVVREGTFEFVQGDRLSDILQWSLGATPQASNGATLLTRLTPDGNSMDSIRINLSDAARDGAGDIELRPGDRLIVHADAELRQNYIVAVEGEVRFEGRYPITRGTTRLTEVITSAGGFTETAFLAGATVLRKTPGFNNPDRLEEEQLRTMRASLSNQDSGYYVTETAVRLKGELVSVDFTKLFKEGDASQDVILQPYDEIRIPARTMTIYVFGQVLSPGHVPFVVGEDASHYIERAGGYTQEARSGDVKIIKASTRVWLDPDETTVEDGDFIWVPREIHYPFSYYITTYAQVASIIGVVATVALLIHNLSN